VTPPPLVRYTDEVLAGAALLFGVALLTAGLAVGLGAGPIWVGALTLVPGALMAHPTRGFVRLPPDLDSLLPDADIVGVQAPLEPFRRTLRRAALVAVSVAVCSLSLTVAAAAFGAAFAGGILAAGPLALSVNYLGIHRRMREWERLHPEFAIRRRATRVPGGYADVVYQER
jgi:hypothetical protein